MTDKERAFLNKCYKETLDEYKMYFRDIMQKNGETTARKIFSEMYDDPDSNKRLLQDAYKAALYKFKGRTRADEIADELTKIATMCLCEAVKRERAAHDSMEVN